MRIHLDFFFLHQTLDRFVVSQQQLDPSIVILSAVVIAGRHIRGQSVRLILTAAAAVVDDYPGIHMDNIICFLHLTTVCIPDR